MEHMHFEQSIVDIASFCGAARQICCSESENTQTPNMDDCNQLMKSVEDVDARVTETLVMEAEEYKTAGAEKDVAKEDIPCDVDLKES